MITDEWKRWHQGGCGTYAVALIRAFPHLRLGGIDFDNDTDPDTGEVFDNPGHFVAHDDEFAYDSAGRHPLPYGGRDGSGRWLPDGGSPEDHGLPDTYEGDSPDADLRDALDHARRHGIVDLIASNA